MPESLFLFQDASGIAFSPKSYTICLSKNYYYHSLFTCCGSLFAQNIQNPVLPGWRMPA